MLFYTVYIIFVFLHWGVKMSQGNPVACSDNPTVL